MGTNDREGTTLHRSVVLQKAAVEDIKTQSSLRESCLTYRIMLSHSRHSTETRWCSFIACVCMCVCECTCINLKLKALRMHLIHLSRSGEPPQNLLTDLPVRRDKSSLPTVPSADLHAAQSTSESNRSFITCLALCFNHQGIPGGRSLPHLVRKF